MCLSNKLDSSWIKGLVPSKQTGHTRESNGKERLNHIAAENCNWEILSHLLDFKTDLIEPGQKNFAMQCLKKKKQ